MNRRFLIKTAAAFLLLTATACAADEVFPAVHNQPITLRVLDGANGKPQPYAHVVLVAGYDRRDLGVGLWRQETVTDDAGVARLSNQFRNLPLVRVEVLKHHGCEPHSSGAAFSVELIRRDGVSGANRCGTVTVEDAPGVLTVFVKGKKDSSPAPVPAVPRMIAASSKSDPAPATLPVPAAFPASASAPASRQPASPASAPAALPASAPTDAPDESGVDPMCGPAHG